MRNLQGLQVNFSHIIERHAAAGLRRPALHFEGQDIGYPQLWRAITAATTALQRAGVKAGERVAWLGLNDPAMLVLLFALARIGAILVPLNYRLTLIELGAILTHAGVGLLAVDETHAATASRLTQTGALALLSARDLFAPAPAQRSAHEAGAGGVAEPAGAIDAALLLVYTSGTTGQPKGALHTQAALLANCNIACHEQALTAEDHVLSVLPMFHVGGLCIQTLPALHAGATVSLHRRFEAGAWLRAVRLRRPSLSLMVPATMHAVLEHAQFQDADLGSLRLLMTGSSVVPIALIEAFHARGLPVGQVYGSTETGPVSICLRREDAPGHPGSAGKPAHQVQVRLAGRQGQDMAPGEVGEILIRAPNLMALYWKDPDNPAFQDGWFHSGDLARIDGEGFYWVVGRSKDMIISGGENIYPAEIENILAGCADIVESAVVGQADPTWGEVAVAVVVKRAGSSLDEAAVLRLFGERLARYKIPKRIVFCASLPKTALGKVQKDQLRSWLGS